MVTPTFDFVRYFIKALGLNEVIGIEVESYDKKLVKIQKSLKEKKHDR